ncbi:dnaJ homolog subfamily C member 1 [Geospiza fortis]|uniref:DnaJ homolog subfamily C member 1 n=1 Tax=Geospiza fortis TaxID=48883 RepID=A0A8N5F3X7_GEOFO|nr:dnaJ homolog subfamily C member 1 [Geospiza fortis]
MRKDRRFCSHKASLALLGKSQMRVTGVIIADHGVCLGSSQLLHVAVQACTVKPVKIGAGCEHPHRDPATRVQEGLIMGSQFLRQLEKTRRRDVRESPEPAHRRLSHAGITSAWINRSNPHRAAALCSRGDGTGTRARGRPVPRAGDTGDSSAAVPRLGQLSGAPRSVPRRCGAEEEQPTEVGGVLFDLVEEVPRNFYDFLGVQQDASSADIRKAYRKLSLILHPDKNKDENAEIQFRQLVAIYEVLKDEERRQRYDDILINGLPDWRQPVFYYRRVRKMSNAELALLLFIILTVGHYAVVWSIYLEKQLDELLSRKKREKKKKAGSRSTDEAKLAALDKNERVLDKPQWHDLLPCKLGIWFCLTVKALPQLFQDARQLYVEYKETKMKEKEDALAKAELETLQKEKKPKVKKPKLEFPVYTALESSGYIPSYDHGASIEEIEEQMDDWLGGRNRAQKKKAPEWTEEDLSQLTRSMVKFPGGTPGRWEKIAHELGRSVADVTLKAKQVKDSVTYTPGTIRLSELKTLAHNSKNYKVNMNLPDHIITQREREEEVEEEGNYNLTSEQMDTQADPKETLASEIRHRRRKIVKAPETALLATKEVQEEKGRGRRQKDFDNTEQEEESDDESRRREKSRAPEEPWTQNQQKLLEMALQQYPKGTSDRWDKIAKCVPGKSKEECIARYKLLVELVQKKKMAKS